jgi:small-conductance mechanosensitive channel
LGWIALIVVDLVVDLVVHAKGMGPKTGGALLLRLGSWVVVGTVLAGLVVTAAQSFGFPAYSIVTGLGVGGVAIGFGAQTLVRDVLAGVFFLVDDAFREGEYIQAGGAKGTVEKISIRSLQLRHHNGPVYTVPFGEIRQVNNLSRDWVIMKLPILLPFGTDPERVRKIVKKLGQELLGDPELGPKFIEPLKSQGVLAIDDRGMMFRFKFTTYPGEQFVVRRTVYSKLQEVLSAEGINFAGREVQVTIDESGDDTDLPFDEKIKQAVTKLENDDRRRVEEETRVAKK